jgi:hypothetical protein
MESLMELHLNSRPIGKQAPEKKVSNESREVRENSEETTFTTEDTEVSEVRIKTAKKPRRRVKGERRCFSGLLPFLRPGWGGRFVAHRVSGGYPDQRIGQPRSGATLRAGGLLSPLPGLDPLAAAVPPLTRWATNLPPHPGRGNDKDTAKKHPQPGRKSFPPLTSGAVYLGRSPARGLFRLPPFFRLRSGQFCMDS